MTYLEKLKTDDQEFEKLIDGLLENAGARYCKVCPAQKLCRSNHEDIDCKDMFMRSLSYDCNDPMLNDIH